MIVPIICKGRSGTLLLRQLLDCHKELYIAEELCHNCFYKKDENIEINKVNLIKKNIKEYGNIVFAYHYHKKSFKINNSDLDDNHRSSLVDKFLKTQNLKIIYLYRNPIDIFISYELVFINGAEDKHYRNPYNIDKIKVNPKKLLNYINDYNLMFKKAHEIFCDIDHIMITYNQLISNLAWAMEHIEFFLNLKKINAYNFTVKKQRILDRKSTIINYNEIKLYLEDNECYLLNVS